MFDLITKELGVISYPYIVLQLIQIIVIPRILDSF